MIKKTSIDQTNSPQETVEKNTSHTTYTVNETSLPNSRMSWLGPIIGIVLVLSIAGSGYAGYHYIKDKLITSGIANMAVSELESNNTSDEYITEFRGEVPSSCGYSMSIPDTINADTGYQQWFYEEVPLTPESFYGFGPASSKKSNVLMATMFFKTKEEKFDLKSTEGYSFKWPGMVSYCINNTESWDLEQFTQSAVDSSNDQQTISKLNQPIAWGDVMVQELNMTGISNGQYVNQPFYLAIIPAESEHSRLVIFQPWGSEDPRLSTDQESLMNNLKNRELSEDLQVGTSAPATGNTQTQIIWNYYSEQLY